MKTRTLLSATQNEALRKFLHARLDEESIAVGLMTISRLKDYVLAELDYKEEILGRYETALTALSVANDTVVKGAAVLNCRNWEIAARYMSLIYQEHKDFKDEWDPIA